MLASLLLAGSLFGPNPAPAERTANYRCEGGVSFSLIYETKGTALVMIGGGAYRLKRAGDDRWTDGQGQSLVVGDSEAVWTSGVDGARKCALDD